MTPNASKQGKFGSLGAVFFVHIIGLYVRVGLAKESTFLVWVGSG